MVRGLVDDRRCAEVAVVESEVEEPRDGDKRRDLLERGDARAGEREDLQVAQLRDAVDGVDRVGLQPELDLDFSKVSHFGFHF